MAFWRVALCTPENSAIQKLSIIIISQRALHPKAVKTGNEECGKVLAQMKRKAAVLHPLATRTESSRTLATGITIHGAAIQPGHESHLAL